MTLETQQPIVRAVTIMQQSFSQFLSAAIVRGTRRKFSRLHADYLEIQLKTPTTTGMAVGDSEASRTATQNSDANTTGDGKRAEPANAGPQQGTINSGLTVGSQVAVGAIKPVDRRTLTGSTPGDFRKSGDTAKAAMDQIANPPGPREQVGQFPLSGKQAATPAPESFLGADGTDKN